MSSGRSLVARWDLSTDNPSDICWRGNHYPGTGANIVGHPNGIAGGRCAEFNGDNSYVDIGDIVELNAVEKFAIAFWMNQNVLDVFDYIFHKFLDGSAHLFLFTDNAGQMNFRFSSAPDVRGRFDYSTVISIGEWHHVIVVFDGTQTGNPGRLKMYVDGNPITLSFIGTIPSSTPDLTGVDAVIGALVNTVAFDGKLDEFMIFNAALTQIQVNDLMIRTRQGRF